MRQVLQNLRSGETSVVDVPVPQPRPGTALVRTAASLVSAGTERMLVSFAEKSLVGKAQARPDLVRQVLDKARREGLLTTAQAALNRLDQPLPLGYSSAGVIESLGEGLAGFTPGQRVACAGGGYAVHADYAVVPQHLMTPLPLEVDFESGAFTTLGAIALHGFRLAQPQLGDRVAVIGLGLLGLLTVGIAAAAGCQVIGVDLDPARIRLAEQFGAVAVARAQAEEAAQSFTSGRGCDAVLICAAADSNDPIVLAGAIARDRAYVVSVGAVGLDLPRKAYFDKEITFLVSRSYGPGRYDPAYEEGGQDYPIGYVRWTEGRNLAAFVELLATERLDVRPLITHRFPITRAPEAYRLISGKADDPYLGVLLTYEDAVLPDATVVHASPDILVDRAGAAAPGKINLGVLGAGNFATAVLFPALRKIDRVRLVGVASAGGLSAQSALQRFGFLYATSDERRVLADPDINTVGIMTRHEHHARQVVAALEAGKHVFCEKPLAITAEGLDAIETSLLAKGAGAELLMVGFNRRFAPLARRLHEFVAGRPEPLVAHYRINAGYLPLDHWLHDPKQGGGRIIGEGCHFVDFLTFLVGAPPETVAAAALPDRGRYRQDNVVLTLRFPDGSVGTVSYLANGDKAFPKERVEVFTGGRVAVLDDFRALETVQAGRRRTVRSRLSQDKGHRAAWEAFAAAILVSSPPPIPYEHLFGVTRATFAAVTALRTGAVVEV
jgi:predicted dehydrogenase